MFLRPCLATKKERVFKMLFHASGRCYLINMDKIENSYRALHNTLQFPFCDFLFGYVCCGWNVTLSRPELCIDYRCRRQLADWCVGTGLRNRDWSLTQRKYKRGPRGRQVLCILINIPTMSGKFWQWHSLLGKFNPWWKSGAFLKIVTPTYFNPQMFQVVRCGFPTSNAWHAWLAENE